MEPRSYRARLLAAAMVMALAAAVGGCQPQGSSMSASDGLATGSTGPASFKGTAALGQAWQADPTNVNKGLAFANGLDALGQTDQQISVLDQLYRDHPNDGRVAAVYGRVLVKSGRAGQALPILEKAAQSPTADWHVHSALASAYDQQGSFDQAQSEYAAALKLQPNQLSVLNNMAMSTALHGDLKRAEQMLRSANALPQAGNEPRLRQNLALVVGLQGRYEEARKIASEDLPADQVEANLEYLKQMSAQPNTWQQLANDKG
jgi:Flp pilus assembly protein TadD